MIIAYPNVILNERSAEVRVLDFQDQDLLSTIQIMLGELSESGGVGLAAPQIGSLRRIIVVDEQAGTDKSNPEVMLNPRIIKKSKKYDQVIEGCLSVPGRKFKVHRAKFLWYTYTTASGIHKMAVADGFKGQIIQHEIDHLDGITIVDRGIEVL